MSLVDPRDHSARMVGRTPWTARDAPVPRPGQRYEHLEGCQLADGGVGRGPGLPTNPAAFHLLGSLGGMLPDWWGVLVRGSIPSLGLIRWRLGNCASHTNTGSGCSTSAPAAVAKATSRSAVFSGGAAGSGSAKAAVVADAEASAGSASLAGFAWRAFRGRGAGGTAAL